MSDPNTFRDVHVYDRQWMHQFEKIRTRVTIEDKVKMYEWILPKLLTVASGEGFSGVKMVMNDTQKAPNYDSANLVFADEILAEILILALKLDEEKLKDLIKNLCEQMGDMYLLGRCGQGRAHRLIQIYQYLHDSYQPIIEDRL